MKRSFSYGKKPLSNPQRSTLSMIAREAYNRLAPGLSESFDEWRKAEARICTLQLPGAPSGGWSISEAPAWTFNALMAHFKSLKGASGEAFDQLTGPSSITKNMIWVISEMERDANLPEGYAAGICRQMWGHDTPQDEDQAKAVLAALKNEIKRLNAASVHPSCTLLPF